MPESQILICHPMDFTGYIVPRSTLMKCSVCGRGVWVAPSSLLILHNNPQIDIQCAACVFTKISPTATFADLTPAQRDEIEKAFEAQGNAN